MSTQAGSSVATSIMTPNKRIVSDGQEFQAYEHDPAAAVKVFQNSLPDPDLELAIQANSEFTLFPKLPPEIRLVVWRLVIPNGGRIWINLRTDPWKLLRLHPVTRCINQESRYETLQHYSVSSYLPGPICASYGLPSLHLYWNENQDVLHMCLALLIISGYMVEKGDGLSNLSNRFLSAFWNEETDSFRCVRFLVIKDWKGTLVKGFDPASEIIRKYLPNVLEKFERLDELRLVIKQPENSDAILETNDRGKAVLHWLTEIFEKKQKEDPKFHVPKISLSG